VFKEKISYSRYSCLELLLIDVIDIWFHKMMFT